MEKHLLKTKTKRQEITKAALVLEDGTSFVGTGFGSKRKVTGEVVFSTSMVGYTESLTDPSYKGQILTLTYPLIGNYGVSPYGTNRFNIPTNFESIGIKATALIIQELCERPHHWASEKTLNQWLKNEGIPGICDIDTRRLTKKLREKGVMLGILEVCKEGQEPNIEKMLEEARRIPDPNMRNLASEVSVQKPVHFVSDCKKKVVVIDCGVKAGIIRNLLARKVDVILVPHDSSSNEILGYKPDGVIVSNGPGDPKKCVRTIESVREIIDHKIPLMGICLGNQILTLAMGGDTYKLKYGHRSQNQPAYDLETGRCYITTQNHGYTVDTGSLKQTRLEPWFINANDKTNEGVRSKESATFAVQWHPEASPGPYDTEFLFDKFVDYMR